MSYELDNLKREVDSLKWQKAENYKLESLKNKVSYLYETLQSTLSIISSIEERLFKLEQKEIERE